MVFVVDGLGRGLGVEDGGVDGGSTIGAGGSSVLLGASVVVTTDGAGESKVGIFTTGFAAGVDVQAVSAHSRSAAQTIDSFPRSGIHEGKHKGKAGSSPTFGRSRPRPGAHESVYIGCLVG